MRRQESSATRCSSRTPNRSGSRRPEFTPSVFYWTRHALLAALDGGEAYRIEIWGV